MNLELLIQLNDVDRRLDDAQLTIDQARATFPHDQAWQYELDFKQAQLNVQRNKIVRARNQILCPN